jgi:hypothetical protein
MERMKLLRRCLPIAALAACALAPSGAHATWPGKPGLVAYYGLTGIQTIRPDGTHHRVVLGDLSGTGFAWSPNGREIASGASGIWRMLADGSHRRLVVGTGYEEPRRSTVTESPAWGPEGDRLLFTASSSWSDPDDETPPRQIDWIWTVHRDGTHLRKLVRGNEAVWSRGGHRIFFVDEDYDVVEINSDGSGHRVLAHNSDYTHSLDLAPGGRRLVYQVDSDDGHHETVRTLDVRTGARTKFSLGNLGVGDVVWAPGGKRLAYTFSLPKSQHDELRTIRPDGHGVRKVLTFPDRDAVSQVAWQTRPR